VPGNAPGWQRLPSVYRERLLPYIVAAAVGGYDRAFIPFPTLRVKQQPPPTNGNLPNVEIVGGGTLITQSLLARGELTAKWLLLDFGERKAIREGAREKLMMANVGFNGTHQKIVFDVTTDFISSAQRGKR
jgi:hypothetical protein